MTYYLCPHCGASLSVALKWDSIVCPFCQGEIVFPETTYVTRQEFLLWSLQQRHEANNKKSDP